MTSLSLLSEYINEGCLDKFRELWHHMRQHPYAGDSETPKYDRNARFEGTLYKLATTKIGVQMLSEYGAGLFYQGREPIPLQDVCRDDRTDEAFIAILGLYEKYYIEHPCLESDGVVARTAFLELSKIKSIHKSEVLWTVYPTISFRYTSATITDLQPRYAYNLQVKWAENIASQIDKRALDILVGEREIGFVNFAKRHETPEESRKIALLAIAECGAKASTNLWFPLFYGK